MKLTTIILMLMNPYLTTMTALQKPDGRVRVIATGMVFRMFVAKCLALQFAKTVESVCSPFQFALSTRAGTDCVGHIIRALTDANPALTVISINGVGACDHVHRSPVLSKLLEVPELQGLLPFASAVHAGYVVGGRGGGGGVRHQIRQREGGEQGGEQGDPLMPLLCSVSSTR